MRNGFKGELTARSNSLGDAKMKLEELYSTCLDENAVKNNPELQVTIDAAVRSCVAAITSYAGTLRSVKTAMESQHLRTNRTEPTYTHTHFTGLNVYMRIRCTLH